jgi:hypothetical protein
MDVAKPVSISPTQFARPKGRTGAPVIEVL